MSLADDDVHSNLLWFFFESFFNLINDNGYKYIYFFLKKNKMIIGDGNLSSYLLNDTTGHLVCKDRILLGTQPLKLSKFKVNGKDGSLFNNVMVNSDRPTII
jgi:hypothetical protein